MKKLLQLKTILFTIIIIISNLSFAQTWDVYSDSLSMGRSVIYTSDSCILATGTPNNGDAGISMKIDINGNLLWTKPNGGYALCETFDSGYIIASAMNYSKSRLRKLDSNGNLLWDSLYAGPAQSELRSVIQASDSGIIACGYNANFGDSTYYIFKTDKNGNFLWQKNIPLIGFGLAREVIEIKGNYYVIGFSGGSSSSLVVFIQLDANGTIILRKDIPLNYRAQAIAQYDDNSMVICGQDKVSKINLSGDTIWHKQFTGEMFDFYSISVTDNGNIIISGSKGYMLGYYDYEDDMILALDENGNMVFTKIFHLDGDNSMASLESVICLSNTDFVVCGYDKRNDSIKMRIIKYHNVDTDISGRNPELKSIIAFPNPTNGKVKIDTEGLINVWVMNVNGKLILESKNAEIDLRAFSKGVYLLRIFTKKGAYTEKIILQ